MVADVQPSGAKTDEHCHSLGEFLSDLPGPKLLRQG